MTKQIHNDASYKRREASNSFFYVKLFLPSSFWRGHLPKCAS